MSPFFVIVVEVNAVITVHGSYREQRRAEEDAARLRRALATHANHAEWSARVVPVQFATAETIRRLHGLSPASEIVIGQHRPEDFRDFPPATGSGVAA